MNKNINRHYGIALRDAEGDFRNFSDVLDDLHAKWGQFDSVDKRTIASTFAGVRQYENYYIRSV